MFYKEFATEEKGILEPSKIIKPVNGFPKVGLGCFSKKLFDQWVEVYKGTKIGHFNTEEGPLPIYKIRYNNKIIAVFLIRVGAPCAAIQLEEIIAMGVEKLIVMGSCGVLDKTVELGKIIIPRYVGNRGR